MSKEAQIVISTQGYWVGKELYPGERYISSDPKRYYHPLSQVVVPDYDTLFDDIERIFKVKVAGETPVWIFKKIAYELCNSSIGIEYCYDEKAPFRVRKITGSVSNYKKD
jgi:hypothetical protein